MRLWFESARAYLLQHARRVLDQLLGFLEQGVHLRGEGWFGRVGVSDAGLLCGGEEESRRKEWAYENTAVAIAVKIARAGRNRRAQ
jgi:hypothetical protein